MNVVDEENTKSFVEIGMSYEKVPCLKCGVLPKLTYNRLGIYSWYCDNCKIQWVIKDSYMDYINTNLIEYYKL